MSEFCELCGEPWTQPMHFCPPPVAPEPEPAETERALDAAMAAQAEAQEAALYFNRTERALIEKVVEVATALTKPMSLKIFWLAFNDLSSAVDALQRHREASRG